MEEQEPFIPRAEYPRPQFARRDWSNLNGVWEFAVDDLDRGLADGWATRETPLGGEILVPFPFQSGREGAGGREVLWYARWFEVPAAFDGREIQLHFGAVNDTATVWVNGCKVGTNLGGHVPFAFNVTPFLREGSNRLVVRAVDTSELPAGRRGGNRRDASGATRTSGIWQTVWLEPLPARRIEHLRLTPVVSRGAIRLQVAITRPSAATTFRLRVSRRGEHVAAVALRAPQGEAELEIGLGEVALWSPEAPALYDLELQLEDEAGVVDRVTSYFGMREAHLDGECFLLNGEPYLPQLVLDQDCFPDWLLSAPCDDALREDVEWAKRFGFNGVRKRQKMQDPRFLYWCDRLGLIVWGEMANAGEYAPDNKEVLAAEWQRIIRRDSNHPCVTAWAPLDESWGAGMAGDCPQRQAFALRIEDLTRALDPTRPVAGRADTASESEGGQEETNERAGGFATTVAPRVTARGNSVRQG